MEPRVLFSTSEGKVLELKEYYVGSSCEKDCYFYSSVSCSTLRHKLLGLNGSCSQIRFTLNKQKGHFKEVTV